MVDEHAVPPGLLEPNTSGGAGDGIVAVEGSLQSSGTAGLSDLKTWTSVAPLLGC